MKKISSRRLFCARLFCARLFCARLFSAVLSCLFSTTLFIPGSVFCEEQKPNILLVITDDQRFDDVEQVMPFTWEHIFERGVRFRRGFATTPACNPSRASILTGQYASRHGAYANLFPLEKKTFVEQLHQQGEYYTGLVGKYLNAWNGSKRPEFDYWVSFAGGSSTYFNPTLNIQGEWYNTEGYITDIFRDFALEFLTKAEKQQRPFLLLLPFNAPHLPLKNPERLKRDFEQQTAKERANFDHPPEGKPSWLKGRGSLSEKDKKRLAFLRKEQWRALRAVDDALKAVVEKLNQSGALQNTVIFFLSDNGHFFGEHRLQSKDAVYEEATRIPFAVRYGDKSAGVVRDELVANIDIAPTIFALSGVQPELQVDGRSLIPLLGIEATPWRERLLLEGFRRYGARNAFVALRTSERLRSAQESRPEQQQYLDFEEYDLVKDPYQLRNLYSGYTESLQSKWQKQFEASVLEYRSEKVVRLDKEKRLSERYQAPPKKSLPQFSFSPRR